MHRGAATFSSTLLLSNDAASRSETSKFLLPQTPSECKLPNGRSARGIRASASPSRRLENARRWTLRRSLESFWVTNEHHEGSREGGRRVYVPADVCSVISRACERCTAVHGGGDEMEHRSFFLAPCKCACVKGRCRCNELPTSSCKRKVARGSYPSSRRNGRDHAAPPLSLWIAPVTSPSYGYGHCASLDPVSQRASVGDKASTEIRESVNAVSLMIKLSSHLRCDEVNIASRVRYHGRMAAPTRS